MRWALQLAVTLAVPLLLCAAVWGGLRLLRWARANRARAAAAGADVLIGEQLGGFRGWLADQVDHLSGSDGGDGCGASDAGDGGDSGGGCSD